VVGNIACHLLAAGELLRGYENFMCDLVAEKPMAHALLDALCAAYMRRADQYMKNLGKYMDVLLVNDDLGTQNGPIISLSTYREMIRPYQKRFFGHLRQIFDGALLMHSCGAVAEFLPDLIACGVQAINPVQISAAGMDPARLKREFGKDIVFWGGGCDTQRTLNRGTPAQVREAVRRNATIFGAGGGFVFTQVHNIQPDVPPENVLAMIQALRAL
jgi:uroporphyrinogen decarboxylase